MLTKRALKYLKSFEKIRTDKIINIGDNVIWLGHNRTDFGKSYSPPTSTQVSYGDMCEIIELKTVKGVIYAKAKNITTGRIIRKWDSKMSYGKGNWFEFDSYFISELDYNIKKYNL
jgi:hypothetical protein